MLSNIEIDILAFVHVGLLILTFMLMMQIVFPPHLSQEDAEGFNEQQNNMPADQDIRLTIDTTAGLTLDDVTEKVERCLQGLEFNDDAKAKEVILSVWDFAGQDLYYASHSVFLSHRAVYVLVHNLSKDLSAQAKPYAKHGTRKIELDNPTTVPLRTKRTSNARS